jgi:hypothetical protein
VTTLGTLPTTSKEGVHVFVADKSDGNRLFDVLRGRFDCRFVSSDNSREDIYQVSSDWSMSKFQVLISTTIALVGNENPSCRHLACAGHLYDSMQIVQAFGRLRPSMRTKNGSVLFGVPENLSAERLIEDKNKFSRLLNERFVTTDDQANFTSTMSSSGVKQWLTDASLGKSGCCLKNLSLAFGMERDACGICPFCRNVPTSRVQTEVASMIELERRNKQASERVLRKMEHTCLVCRKGGCRGIPVLRGHGSRFLPENQEICFSWNMCYRCGVSNHDRKTQCFDKSYLNRIACSECWVFKGVPGSKIHEMSACEVKGRLRRILSHNFLKQRAQRSFQQYLEAIYTSSETFCAFMAAIEERYI